MIRASFRTKQTSFTLASKLAETDILSADVLNVLSKNAQVDCDNEDALGSRRKEEVPV
jgi:hypothetical protein